MEITLDQCIDFQAPGTKIYVLRLVMFEEVTFYMTYWLFVGKLQIPLLGTYYLK